MIFTVVHVEHDVGMSKMNFSAKIEELGQAVSSYESKQQSAENLSP